MTGNAPGAIKPGMNGLSVGTEFAGYRIDVQDNTVTRLSARTGRVTP